MLKVHYGGECKSYAVLRHTAWHLLDFAKTHEAGSLLQLKASAVFCAFTFEAYLNHVGSRELPFWKDIERIPYQAKLSVIAKHLGLAIDRGISPFQSISALFSLRDSLAHGKTFTINELINVKDTPEFDSMTRLLPWEKLTIEDLDRYFQDVDTAIEQINSARSNPDSLLWDQGSRSRCVS